MVSPMDPKQLNFSLIRAVPFFLWGFFKIITPFIDPITREKLKFNEDMSLRVPRAQLLKANGGDVEFVYDHSVYWPAFIQLAAKRKGEYQARWEKAGKRIGEHEDYLRGGAERSLAESEGNAAPVVNRVNKDLEKQAEMQKESGQATLTA